MTLAHNHVCIISKIGIKCKMRWFSLRNRASFYNRLLSSSERSKTYIYEERRVSSEKASKFDTAFFEENKENYT